MIKYTNLNKLILYLENKPEYTSQATFTSDRNMKGKEGEVGFARVLWSIRDMNRAKGIECDIFASTIVEDGKQHWDLAIKINGNLLKFDVKNNMTTNYVNKNISMWAEFRNTTGGVGSAVGQSNFLSVKFENKDVYLVINRIHLVEMIERKMGKDRKEISKSNISYYPGFVERYTEYQRKKTNEVIIKVPLEDIKEEIQKAKLFSFRKMELFKKDEGVNTFF